MEVRERAGGGRDEAARAGGGGDVRGTAGDGVRGEVTGRGGGGCAGKEREGAAGVVTESVETRFAKGELLKVELRKTEGGWDGLRLGEAG